MTHDSTEDWLRLNLTPGLGRKALFRLIETFGTPGRTLKATPQDWIARCGIRDEVAYGRISSTSSTLVSARKRLEAAHATIVSYWDAALYPPALRTIHDPPALLYIRGNLHAEKALAIVGSRRASPGGLELTRQIATELSGSGICIVSGLARGIDTEAHCGALAGGGETIAVLGCGIDQIYPRENTRLYLQIEDHGAIITEYPPGTPPMAGHFPGRNRIISGLSRGVLVVEAAHGSGSLHTAEFALESGREVFAVPNAVQSSTAGGVNQLIKDGARVVTESRDIIEALWPELSAPDSTANNRQKVDGLSDNQLNILNLLSFNPTHTDIISRKSSLTPMEVSDILLHLELAGFATQLPGGHYVRTR